MKLSLILTHNKTMKKNEAQIEALKPFIRVKEEFLDGVDAEGNILPNYFTRKYFQLIDFPFDHELEIIHVIAYQPWNTSSPYEYVKPANMMDLNSYTIAYGNNDIDKTDDHPRFFNIGFKRGIDHGADIVIHLEDYTQLSIEDLAIQINTLLDPDDKHEFIEDLAANLTTKKLFKEVGQLNETKNRKDAIEDLKARATKRGLING